TNGPSPPGCDKPGCEFVLTPPRWGTKIEPDAHLGHPREGTMKPIRSTGLFLLGLFACGPAPTAEPPEKKTETARYEMRKDLDPNGIGKFYMGREIAQVMVHEAAGWLERPEREREERSSKLLESLQLKNGLVVADVGAGSGYFTFPIAEKIGPKG